MFGADTPLVMDAIQIAVLAAGAGGIAIYALLRRRKPVADQPSEPKAGPTNLEQRVRVLERIATDRSIDLADEIEALRDDAREEQTEGASQ